MTGALHQTNVTGPSRGPILAAPGLRGEDRDDGPARPLRLARSANGEKTHCHRGHPYAGDNLKLRKNGERLCRACRLINEHERGDTRRAPRLHRIAALALPADPVVVHGGRVTLHLWPVVGSNPEEVEAVFARAEAIAAAHGVRLWLEGLPMRQVPSDGSHDPTRDERRRLARAARRKAGAGLMEEVEDE